jgi:hypothetical protein
VGLLQRRGRRGLNGEMGNGLTVAVAGAERRRRWEWQQLLASCEGSEPHRGSTKAQETGE